MRPNHAHPRLELKHLVQNRGVNFDLTLSEAEISEIIEQLELLSLRKIKFSGVILPIGKGDWGLSGELGATVEQACSLTLAPVRSRIDTPVVRNFRKSPITLSHSGPEHEIPEDDSEEQLEDVIDLARVFSEALSLALPDYPRAEGAELRAVVQKSAPKRYNSTATIPFLSDPLPPGSAAHHQRAVAIPEVVHSAID